MAVYHGREARIRLENVLKKTTNLRKTCARREMKQLYGRKRSSLHFVRVLLYIRRLDIDCMRI